jgi:hypothetical protein
MKRTKLRVKGISSISQLKDDIQYLVRLIVTIRDGGCILRSVRGCGAIASVLDDKVVSDTTIQADHLITRANSATYADTRLIVCLCKGCHGWKHWHEKEYDEMVKKILPKDRVELWKKCEEDMHAHKTCKKDWAMEKLILEQEYKKLL